MSIYRIYPSKSNTIASGIFQNINSGQNPVTDLWYGGGGTDSSPDKRNSFSRFLIHFDISELNRKIQEKEINEDRVISYRLKMKNSKPLDLVLETDYEYDKLKKSIASSFDLLCFPINKFWDGGRGYDLTKELYVKKQKGKLQTSGYSNWNSATYIEQWDESGIFTNPTASTQYYTQQHFDLGNEDINMDVTDIVKDWLSGGSENYGISVCYNRNYEIISSDTRYISSFFTEKTNTCFKPFLEVEYDQTIEDDRKQVSNNRESNLFLYTFSGHTLANIKDISQVKVDIKKGQSLIYENLVPIHLSKGVYYINVLMSGSTPGEIYTDTWKNVNIGDYDNNDIDQKFQIQKDFFSNKPSINNYALEVYGIEQNIELNQDDNTRIYCQLRTNYSTKPPQTKYLLQYKIVMNNQIEIIPWTNVNQSIINDCNENYFDIDTSWFLHNQTYQISFKINEMGISRVMPEKIDFRVLKPF